MIHSSGRVGTLLGNTRNNWRFKDEKIPTLPFSFTAVVSSLKRVFAWVCG